MNVYRGTSRRQVGGGLFSTIGRGAKPIILSLLAKLRPHVLNATKAVGKRAAKAALNVGSDLATNFVTGRLNKRKAKDIVQSELDDIRSDTNKVIENYKTKFAQTGNGKRRKLYKRKTKPKTKRRKNINKGMKVKRLIKNKAGRIKKVGKKKIKKLGRLRKKIGKSKKVRKVKKLKKKQYKRKRVFNNDIFGK